MLTSRCTIQPLLNRVMAAVALLLSSLASPAAASESRESRFANLPAKQLEAVARLEAAGLKLLRVEPDGDGGRGKADALLLTAIAPGNRQIDSIAVPADAALDVPRTTIRICLARAPPSI